MHCPTGESTFSSEQGMKAHHKQVHGESIAGFSIDCESCGDTVRKSTLEDGEHHFCSTACQNEWQSDYHSGENNPSFKDRTITVTCYECGDEFGRFMKDFKRNNKQFCSQECNHSWQSRAFSGEGNPNWKGGKTQIEYGSGWRTARREAQEYYNNTCQECDASEESLGRKPDIHHIKPVDSFEEKSDAHADSNLIQLCRTCHLSKVERMSIDEQRERFKEVLR